VLRKSNKSKDDISPGKFNLNNMFPFYFLELPIKVPFSHF